MAAEHRKNVVVSHRKAKELHSFLWNKQVEANPPLWDPADEGFSDRQVKQEIWARICRTLYPEWDELEESMQKRIAKDIKNRWRSVRDQYRKQENDAEKSGSSPVRRKKSHFDQLTFLKTSRVLRPSAGNVPSPPEDATTGTDSQLTTASTADLDHSPEEGQNSLPSTSTQMARESENDTGTTRGSHPRRGTRRQSATQPGASAIERETLALLQRVDGEDHWDHMAYSVAARIRQLPQNRQWACVSAIFQVMELYASSGNLPENIEILHSIHGLRAQRNVHGPCSGHEQANSNVYHHVPHTVSNPTFEVPVRPGRTPSPFDGEYASSSMSFINLLNTPNNPMPRQPAPPHFDTDEASQPSYTAL